LFVCGLLAAREIMLPPVVFFIGGVGGWFLVLLMVLRFACIPQWLSLLRFPSFHCLHIGDGRVSSPFLSFWTSFGHRGHFILSGSSLYVSGDCKSC
jgi:hypothetical protein